MQILVRLPGQNRTVPVAVFAQTTFGDVLETLKLRDVWLEYRGRSWGNRTVLASAGVQSGSQLTANLRLCGGGGDGGSTGAESRDCYLEMYLKRKPDKVNPAEEKLAKWTRCQLSGEVLQAPCAADELGHLFNKDAVVQALVSKTIPAALSHICNLRHLIDLKLEKNPNYSKMSSAAANGYEQLEGEAPFQCPVTGLLMNGTHRFIVLRSTGHVVSERALNVVGFGCFAAAAAAPLLFSFFQPELCMQVPSAVAELVGKQWSEEDILPLNGAAEQVEALRAALLAKRIRKSKKGKVSKKDVKLSPHMGTEVGQLIPPVTASSESLDVAAREELGVRNIVKLVKPLKRIQSVDYGSQAHKKPRAAAFLPQQASKDVWNSIFLSGRPGDAFEKETFTCRSTSARGMNLT